MAEGPILRFGRVTDVNDPYGAGRIKARTNFDNKTEENKDLEYYIPLLPKMLHVKPKVGELVLLFSMAPGKLNSFGYYIGPLISQPDKLFYEDASHAMALTETGYYGWDVNPELKKGVQETLYPANDDVTLEGRKDAGLQLKDEEVRIKAGVKVVENNINPRNNLTSPAFISLKYYPKNDYELDGFKSTATIVADKINLIGTPSSTEDPNTKEIPVTQNKDRFSEEKDTLISDSAMKELLNKAHRVPYGDTLIEFLNILKTALANHVHPFPTMTPCEDENMKAVGDYDLESMLSDIVRIN